MEPSHKSEQVSQLLFGELYEVVREQQSWFYIKCSYDKYEGWIDSNQHQEMSLKEFNSYTAHAPGIALEIVSSATSSIHSLPVLAGSSLPFFDGMNFKICKEKFIYNGQAVQAEAMSPILFERIALRYLSAPYLWGGRSPFGIDCSGFTQIVFKFIGIALPRDAFQQAEVGTGVNFIEESLPGDLAFFSNEDGKIIHTGIVLKDNRIIHASAKVKIDKLDHFGIYNNENKEYSHKLKIIKRFF